MQELKIMNIKSNSTIATFASSPKASNIYKNMPDEEKS